MAFQGAGVMDGMSSLPLEILENIFSQVPFLDLTKNCVCVCKHWYKIISNPKFLIWKKTYHRLISGHKTATKKMEEILVEEGFFDEPQMLPVNIAKFMNDFRPIRNESSLVDTLKQHPKFNMIKFFLKKSSKKIQRSPWSILSLLCLISTTVRDVFQVITCMIQEKSCLGYEVLEALYLLASIYWVLKSQSRINSGIHYRIKYACYLYENSRDYYIEEEDRLNANSIRPTYEQNAIIKHNIKPREVIKIVAFAGTGKTTTLVKFTERHPEMFFLNVCYNKSIQQQAEKLFPTNVECRTWHSLAYRAIGERYKSQLGGSLRVQNITNCLSKETTFLHARRVMKALGCYISSSRPTITILDVEDCPPIDSPVKNKYFNSKEYKQNVVRDAKTCWNVMINLNDKRLYMTHDGYLKLYQLSNPLLEQFDCILIDEAQDCTPANASILQNQNCTKILVGDPYQQIYSFRGAKNVMDEIRCTTTFYLTESFRFGSEIGYLANSLLECLKDCHHKTLVGNSTSGSVLGERSGQLAIICRTNFCLFQEAVRVCQTGSRNRIAFAGGIRSYSLDRVLAIYKLFNGERCTDPFLRQFTFKSLEKYARDAADKELMGKIKIVQFYGMAVPGHVQAIQSIVTDKMEQADIVFSTVHKAKGLEFDTVRVADDFTIETSIYGIPMENPEDEKNMLYVAVTRAKHRLQINNIVRTALKLNKEYFLRPMENHSFSKKNPPECIYCYNPLVLEPMPHVIITRPNLTVYKAGVREGSSQGVVCITCAMEKVPHFGPLVNPKLPAKTTRKKKRKEKIEEEEDEIEEEEEEKEEEDEETEDEDEQTEEEEEKTEEEEEEKEEGEEQEEEDDLFQYFKSSPVVNGK